MAAHAAKCVAPVVVFAAWDAFSSLIPPAMAAATPSLPTAITNYATFCSLVATVAAMASFTLAMTLTALNATFLVGVVGG